MKNKCYTTCRNRTLKALLYHLSLKTNIALYKERAIWWVVLLEFSPFCLNYQAKVRFLRLIIGVKKGHSNKKALKANRKMYQN